MRIRTNLAVALLLLSAGCASTPYADFAKAGRTYAAGLSSVLDTAADMRVNASSELLVLHAHSAQEVADKNNLDTEQLRMLKQLRDHAKKLAAYFDALDDLAESKAPDDASKAAGNAFDAVQKAGVPLAGYLKTPVLIVTKLVVSGIHYSQLRRELIAHQESVREELATQRALIDFLRDKITREQGDILREANQRLAHELASGSLAAPEAWIERRRQLLREPDRVADVDDASKALDKLQTAFDSLVTGQLTTSRMRRLEHEIELLVRKGGAA
jgi:hypothetical protein